MQTKPALSLAAVAGRRHALIDLAVRLEEEGFDGVFSPSMGDAMGRRLEDQPHPPRNGHRQYLHAPPFRVCVGGLIDA